MKKINVVGTSGSGKTTFSRKLAEKLNYPYLEMDSMFWKSNWIESTNDELFKTLEQEIAKPEWVLDGNYSRTAEIKWADVDTIIWLDFSFFRTLIQVLKRSIHRSLTKEGLWNTNNRESFKKQFFSKDSIILWTFTTYKKKRITYETMIENDKYRHINFVRLKSPMMANDFLLDITEK